MERKEQKVEKKEEVLVEENVGSNGIWDIDQQKLKERIRGVLTPADFIQIGNNIEIKRSGILKILHIARELFNLSIEAQKEILGIKDYVKSYTDRNGVQQEFQDTYCIVRTTITVQNKDGLYHRTQSMGSAQLSEVRNRIHVMLALAETRSLKRAIEEIFPNLINDAILELFGTYSVVDDMEMSNQFSNQNGFTGNQNYQGYQNQRGYNRQFQGQHQGRGVHAGGGRPQHQQSQSQPQPQPQQHQQPQPQNRNMPPIDFNEIDSLI